MSFIKRKRSIAEPQLKGVKTRLECRGSETGPRYFLEVTPEGKVQGCPEGDGESTLLYLIPVGLRVVTIQHVQSQLYIAMNSDGRLITTDTFSTECKFKENVFENYWCIYSSIQYKHPETQRPWHIGINSKGNCIRGPKAKKHKPAAHFLPRPIEVVMMREPSNYDLIVPSRSSSDAADKHHNSASDKQLGENNV